MSDPNKMIVDDAERAIAQVLLGGKGKLLNLPNDGGIGGSDQLVWSGLIVHISYNGLYKRTAIRLLGGDTLFTNLSVAEVGLLLEQYEGK